MFVTPHPSESHPISYPHSVIDDIVGRRRGSSSLEKEIKS
jgi:hypothetical protein